MAEDAVRRDKNRQIIDQHHQQVREPLPDAQREMKAQSGIPRIWSAPASLENAGHQLPHDARAPSDTRRYETPPRDIGDDMA
jgi:hypothetical protein